MPIKDLQRNEPGIARAGIIRLGYKVKKCAKCNKLNFAHNDVCGNNDCGHTKFGKPFPKAASHFVLNDAPGVSEAIGTDKPTELKIFFPFDDIDLVFPAYHHHWVASALVCRGDGEHILYAINPQTGAIVVRDGRAIDDFELNSADGNDRISFKLGSEVFCPGLNNVHPYSICQHCKPNAMLLVLLADIPRLAYWQIATTSIHNIVNLTKQLTYIKNNIGGLTGVPFILKLSPQKISVPNGKGRIRTEKYLLSLEVDADWFKRLLSTQGQLADPKRLLLADGIPDEADIIDAEIEQQKPPQPEPKSYQGMEPPVWLPPNGDDDNNDEDYDEWVKDSYDAFCKTIMTDIPFYTSKAEIDEAFAVLEIVYNPDDKQNIFNALAKYAQAKADEQAANGEQSKLL